MHSLVQGYDLEGKMVVHRPKARTFEELTMFHADDYISFIRAATPNHSAEYMQQLKRLNMGAPGESDCPVFDGMYEYFAVSRSRGRGGRVCGCGRRVWGGRRGGRDRGVKMVLWILLVGSAGWDCRVGADWIGTG